MQEYDAALKLLLRGSAQLTLRELAGSAVENWLDVELPKVQNLRLDLLGETVDRSLIHLELQSSNDAAMPLRMAEYCLGIFRSLGRFPRQVLLYVGEAPLRMNSELRGPDVWFRYRAVDIRDLDGDRLLESAEVGDNVIAILARLRDHKDAVRRIVERIAGSDAAGRETALGQVLILTRPSTTDDGLYAPGLRFGEQRGVFPQPRLAGRRTGAYRVRDRQRQGHAFRSGRQMF